MASPEGPPRRLVYTEAMVRDAVRTFVWRRAVAAQRAPWAVALGLLALLAWLVRQGDRSWVLGVVGAAAALPPLLAALVWFAHHRNSVGRFRRMRAPVATASFGADGLTVASDLGTATLPWSSVTDAWERPGYWMVFTGPAQFLTLPVAEIPAEELAQLRARVRKR